MPDSDGRDGASQARAFFGRHAADYARSAGHRSGEDLALAVGALEPLEGMECLDVATGTGFCAVALARAGGRVTAVDLTAEMLEQAAGVARSADVAITFVEADALRLPFADSNFDRVSCRRAAHHFDNVAAVLQEIRRVLRPGGRLAIADVSPPAAAATFLDGIERTRDASHRHALTPEEWRAAFEQEGFSGIRLELCHERQSFDTWYYPVTDPKVRARIEAALAVAPPAVAEALGLAKDASGQWQFIRQRAVVSGHRPA